MFSNCSSKPQESMYLPLNRLLFAPFAQCLVVEMRITMRHHSILASIQLACIASGIAPAQTGRVLPYRDVSLPLEKRVDDLVSRMTLEEKISQMTNDSAAIPRLNIAAYNWWNEGLHGVARSGAAHFTSSQSEFLSQIDSSLEIP